MNVEVFLFAIGLIFAAGIPQTLGCCEENETLPNPDNSEQFFRCLQGELSLLNCTNGQLFDPISKQCTVRMILNYTTSQTTSDRPETSEIELPTDTSCYQTSDGIMQHATDCDKFIVCKQGVAKLHVCPRGQVFSWQTLSCGSLNSCESYFKSQEKSTVEEAACKRQKLPLASHPFEGYKYVVCASLTTVSCPSGKIFREHYQRCLPGSQNTNQLQIVRRRCGFWKNHRHPYLCEKFMTCRFGIFKIRSCPNGTIYTGSKKKCRRGNFRTCQFT